MLNPSLCDYSDAYSDAVNNTATAGADVNNTNKKVMIKIVLHLLTA